MVEVGFDGRSHHRTRVPIVHLVQGDNPILEQGLLVVPREHEATQPQGHSHPREDLVQWGRLGNIAPLQELSHHLLDPIGEVLRHVTEARLDNVTRDRGLAVVDWERAVTTLCPQELLKMVVVATLDDLPRLPVERDVAHGAEHLEATLVAIDRDVALRAIHRAARDLLCRLDVLLLALVSRDRLVSQNLSTTDANPGSALRVTGTHTHAIRANHRRAAISRTLDHLPGGVVRDGLHGRDRLTLVGSNAQQLVLEGANPNVDLLVLLAADLSLLE